MKYIKFFKDINLSEIPLVGGKNAALGQMIQDLSGKIRIPNGFAITVKAYNYLLSSAGIPVDDNAAMRTAILHGEFPADLAQEITQSYQQLCTEYNQPDLSVAVRSSATTEDLPNASFAGQQETYLHISGAPALLDAVKKCMASLFTDRAIAYRQEKGFSSKDIGISVGVQKMVNSDDATSGVMFTLETESGHPGFITINAAYGLGETIVGGTVTPDEFMVHKDKLRAGYKPLVKKTCGDKQVKALYNAEKKVVETVPVTQAQSILFSLSDAQIFELAQFGLVIEDYFTKRNNGVWTPMDIEWAQDSIDKKLYIVQARPETVHSAEKKSQLQLYSLNSGQELKTLVSGLSIGRKIASGIVRIIADAKASDTFQKGDILVTQMTDPDWVPLMKKAAAIITDRGGRTCHAAIVARELGVPALIGTGNATQLLHDGQLVTVDCSNGSQGFVYEGKLSFATQDVSVDFKKTDFDLLVNIADPDRACDVALLPIDGAGLVRAEFIIAQRIGIHPMAIVFPEKVPGLLNDFTKERSSRYGSLQEFYIEELSQSIGLIVAALYPRTAVVRLTDFKSNEYRDLLGGDLFEPQEENPMLGFRGASRYCDARYAPAFELECKALVRVRQEMGFENMVILVPFVRTVQEAKETLDILAKNNLVRGKDGLKIYLMVEIPANVIIFEQFAEYFDGFSIGSNDLTQLTLGVDRDSGILHNLFNENDPAVKALISQAITKAHAAKKHISICGQAPSDYPDFAQWLIEQKIDALSLNPDAILPFLLKQNK